MDLATAADAIRSGCAAALPAEDRPEKPPGRGITTKRIRRGAFPRVAQLVAAIQSCFEEHKLDPKPFIWAAKAGDNLAGSRELGHRLRKCPVCVTHCTSHRPAACELVAYSVAYCAGRLS